ncbi:hypothetical protein sos41_32290 [Alphaproteobacteria bacterium SO-S41]|nr:hypothetical protein sos41_32290 [Alphaproteobacteria bacterium SO-S41]
MGAMRISLRSDEMLDDQREVLNYWASLKRDGALPRRADFKPAAIVRRLPTISLVDVDLSGEGFRYRLAGTGLREAFSQDLTGRALEQEDWRAIYRDIAASAAPASGYMPLLRKDRPSLVQAWLRLPLADDDGRVTTILGYDRFIPLQRKMTAAPADLPSWEGAIAALAADVFQPRQATI